MTVNEALRLRETWRSQGSPTCEHASLELERKVGGQLTGGYVCTRCGAEVFRIRPPNGFVTRPVPPI
jgi:hypothetical protein